MIDPHSIFLLVSTLIAVIVLILLISVAKLNPFLTLFLVSLALAVVAGMPLSTVIHSFETGLGSTLGHIAIVVALGTMLGKMMAESGGADQIAHTLIRLFGEKRIPWILLAPTLLIMTLVGFFPLVHSLYVSMTSLRPTEADKPQGFNGIENYIQALADPQFGHSLRRTCRCSTTSSFP